jgi:hypothetical protein
MARMKSKIAVLLAATLVAAVAGTGCYRTVEGRSKVGMPFKKDTIEGNYERTVSQVYPAARKVLEYNGTLRRDDNVTRTLEARIDTRYVYVKIVDLEPNLTRVIVQARTKNGGADVDLAAEIEKQIALQLK